MVRGHDANRPYANEDGRDRISLCGAAMKRDTGRLAHMTTSQKPRSAGPREASAGSTSGIRGKLEKRFARSHGHSEFPAGASARTR